MTEKEAIRDLIEVLGKPTRRWRDPDDKTSLNIRWKETKFRRGLQIKFIDTVKGRRVMFDIIEDKGSIGSMCKVSEIVEVAKQVVRDIPGLMIVFGGVK